MFNTHDNAFGNYKVKSFYSKWIYFKISSKFSVLTIWDRENIYNQEQTKQRKKLTWKFFCVC